jgi:hypothetical protein
MDPLTQALAELTTQVTQNVTVEGSAVTFIQGLAAQILLYANDPATVTNLAQQLQTSATALATAISANTPAAAPAAAAAPVAKAS